MTAPALYGSSLSAVTIGTTEWSVPRNLAYSSASLQSTGVWLQGQVDFSAVTTADSFILRLRAKIVSGGTLLVLLDRRVSGPEVYVLPMIGLMTYGWDLTLQKVSGTDRAITATMLGT